MSHYVQQTVVVPIDFSGHSISAVRAGLEIAESPSGVHLLHVLFPLDSISPGALWGDMNDEKRKNAIQEHFQTFLKEHDLQGVATAVRVGDPGLEIADYARTTDADLIVIPSHGYHGVKRLILGSVAERVIRHAHCSVLVMRRNDD